MAELKAVSFDCYGTLIDWEGGIGQFLYDLERRIADGDEGAAVPAGSELARRWEQIQFERLGGAYKEYRAILREALRAWCGERGHRWNEGEGRALEHAMMSWQPFPDVVPVLRAVKAAGLRTAIVSNCDRSIMEHSLRQFGGHEFDAVVLAEDVAVYKPDRKPFIRLLDTLDLRPAEILHVAFGFRYDIGTAMGLGFRTAWVNRHREPNPGGDRPDHEWTDLWPLADLVA